MSEPVPAPPRDRSHAALVGGATLAILALYLPFLGAPFEYDDKVEIVLNQVIRHPGDVGEIVAYNPFRVLLLYTFAADVWAWGILAPQPYRLENIGIHVANTALLAGLLRRLAPLLLPAASASVIRTFTAFGTLAFAVHPLAIESVTYITGRSSSLATTFVLLSTVAYLRASGLGAGPDVQAWVASRRRRNNRRLGAALAAGAAAALPAAWLHARGTVAAERAILGAVAGTAALLVLGAAVAGRREPTDPADPQVAARGRSASRWYTLSFTAFVLGTLTKEIAAVLPGVLFLVEAVAIRRSWRGGLAALRGRLFPFFAVPAFLIALRVAAYGYIASPDPIRPWGVNLATQVEVVVEYLRLWAWPFPQSIHHDHPVVELPGTLRTGLSAAAVVGLLGAGLAGIRRAPASAFGVLLMLGALAPTSSVFALKETMVEHRTYLPSVGFAFVVGDLLARGLPRLAGRRLRVGIAVGAAWLVGLAVLHVRYDRLWMNEETLWRQAVTVNPRSSDAWRYLGDLYIAQRRWDDAERALTSAIEARPGNVEAHNKLGHVLAVSGRVDEAEGHFRAALAANDCFAPALNNLATARRLRREAEAAIELYARALDCDPTSWVAHRGLADIYWSHLQDRDKAAHHYSMALERMDPLSPVAGEIKKRLMELSW